MGVGVVAEIVVVVVLVGRSGDGREVVVAVVEKVGALIPLTTSYKTVYSSHRIAAEAGAT